MRDQWGIYVPVADLLRNQPSIPDVLQGLAQVKQSPCLKCEPGQSDITSVSSMSHLVEPSSEIWVLAWAMLLRVPKIGVKSASNSPKNVFPLGVLEWELHCRCAYYGIKNYVLIILVLLQWVNIKPTFNFLPTY